MVGFSCDIEGEGGFGKGSVEIAGWNSEWKWGWDATESEGLVWGGGWVMKL